MPSDVASAGIDLPCLLEQRQSADQRRAEVGHDDVDLGVLGDFSRQHLLCQRRIPVGHGEGLGVDEDVFGPKHILQPLEFIETLAVAGRTGEEQTVAALWQDALDPVAPVLAVVDEGSSR